MIMIKCIVRYMLMDITHQCARTHTHSHMQTQMYIHTLHRLVHQNNSQYQQTRYVTSAAHNASCTMYYTRHYCYIYVCTYMYVCAHIYVYVAISI